MSLYDAIIKPLARNMDTDRASRIGLRYFQLIGKIPFGRKINRWIHSNHQEGLQREVFGLSFYNPVGLGAGLDIHCELYNDLNNLGFSFTEVGPMGADGVRKAIDHIQADPPDDIIAVCISEDYLTSFTLAYDFFDMFIIDLTDDPSTEETNALLESRINEQEYKPIIIKLPDYIGGAELDHIADFCLMNSIDGLELRSDAQVRQVHEHTGGRLPIIANCHIDTPEQAAESLKAGASLVEIRTGLLREGPEIVGKTLKYLKNEKAGTI